MATRAPKLPWQTAKSGNNQEVHITDQYLIRHEGGEFVVTHRATRAEVGRTDKDWRAAEILAEKHAHQESGDVVAESDARPPADA